MMLHTARMMECNAVCTDRVVFVHNFEPQIKAWGLLPTQPVWIIPHNLGLYSTTLKWENYQCCYLQSRLRGIWVVQSAKHQP